MYKVQMQFIPNNDSIWVERLHPTDSLYVYDNEQEAIDKAKELQDTDITNRKYRVVS